MSQENRSLDNYFGAMREYWANNGILDQSFDGLPQFNPATGIAPLQGPVPALPGCDPTQPLPSDCVWDPSTLVSSFHFTTVCNENTSPSWNEAHVDWDYYDQVGRYNHAQSALNNGFVWTAAHDARTNADSHGPAPFYDVSGQRAMGYWDGTDLNYDYFMATAFGTSDRFFQPAMTRTNPNREFLIAATSGGYAYTNGYDANDTARLTSKTIYEELTDANISWKIYVNPGDGANPVCPGPPYVPSCLMSLSYLQNFTYASSVLNNNPQNIAPIEQYFTDLTNGTLPQVVQIEPASDTGEDEHGTDADTGFPTNIQLGVQYVSTIINALMNTAGTANDSWSSSAFILTYDESGGMYDHVAPVSTVSPDGIKPVDLPSDSVCYQFDYAARPHNDCDFTWTGNRIPLIVISPYAKKNYVSHTNADATAILKFIETRFGLSALNARDAAQPDMTEFFDFANPVWMTPPTPPAQNTSNPCYLNSLP
jgi:phospholipase C